MRGGISPYGWLTRRYLSRLETSSSSDIPYPSKALYNEEPLAIPISIAPSYFHTLSSSPAHGFPLIAPKSTMRSTPPYYLNKPSGILLPPIPSEHPLDAPLPLRHRLLIPFNLIDPKAILPINPSVHRSRPIACS
jgi:hypothetical protein